MSLEMKRVGESIGKDRERPVNCRCVALERGTSGADASADALGMKGWLLEMDCRRTRRGSWSVGAMMDARGARVGKGSELCKRGVQLGEMEAGGAIDN